MIWKIISSTARSRARAPDEPPHIRVGDRLVPVKLRPMRQARRYRLSVDSAKGQIRLTMPLKGSAAKALAWAGQHEAWIEEQLDKAAAQVRLVDGAMFPLEGRTVRIIWTAGARTVRLQDDLLLVGGPAESVGPRILRWLKARARTVLAEETRTLAARHGLPLTTVGIGDPRSRWGSCAANGAIRYNWRLICAPPEVRRATVSHEVAHLRHLDHSPAFHAFHAEIHGGETRTARRWLKAHGTGLHAIG